MSIWSMLSFAESAKANEKLDDIRRQNEANIQNIEEKEVNQNISKLFQDLYNNDNDISKVNLSTVSNINDYINERFNIVKSRNEPKRNYLKIFFILILIFIVFNLYQSGGITIFFVASAVLLVSLFFSAKVDEENISFYKKRKKIIMTNLKKLKFKYGYLSAFGLYIKFYLDNQCSGVVQILNQHNNEDDNKKIDIAKYHLYKLFELNAFVEEFRNYEYDIVDFFNKAIIDEFNNLSLTEDEITEFENLPSKLDGDSVRIRTINNEIDLIMAKNKMRRELLYINANFRFGIYTHYDLLRFSILLHEYTSEDGLDIDIDGNIIENNSEEVFKFKDKIKDVIKNNKDYLLKIFNEKNNIEAQAENFIKEINKDYHVIMYSYISYYRDKNNDRKKYVKYSVSISKYYKDDRESESFELDKNAKVIEDNMIDLADSDKQKIIEYFYK